jgi:hypothetical protein
MDVEEEKKNTHPTTHSQSMPVQLSTTGPNHLVRVGSDRLTVGYIGNNGLVGSVQADQVCVCVCVCVVFVHAWMYPCPHTLPPSTHYSGRVP